MKKIFVHLIIIFIIALMQCVSLHSNTLNGRLIRLEFEGNDNGLKSMIQSFLNERGIILSENKDIPVIKIKGGYREEHKEGYKISFSINNMEIIINNSEIIYSKGNISDYYYGDKVTALNGALSILKQKLNKDKLLIEKLSILKTKKYYDISGDDLNLTKIAEEIVKNRKRFEKNQDLIKKQITSIYEELKKIKNSGSDHVTQDKIDSIIRHQNNKCINLEAECNSPLSNSKYHAFDAILIKVPVKNYNDFRTGQYLIYSENNCLLYKSPRHFEHIKKLKKSSYKDLFKNNKYYLEINAVKYISNERAIIISYCDALHFINSNIKGLNPGSIFKKNKIFIVPDF